MAHRLHHLDGANRVKRRVADVAVVLQPQVGPLAVAGAHAQALHARIGVGQLLGAECYTHDRRAQVQRGLLGQRAPAAADFQHTVAALHAGHLQRAAHFGVLRLWQRAGQVALKPGAGIVHGLIQPETVKRVAQVVVGVDVLAAVGAAVVVQQVFDAVQQPSEPCAEDHGVDLLAVGGEHLEQFGQVRCAPVPGNIALGKTDVAGLECRAKHVPVVQRDAGAGMPGRVQGVLLRMLAKTALRTIGQVQGERAVAQVLQQTQCAAGSRWRVFGKCDALGRAGGNIHGGLL